MSNNYSYTVDMKPEDQRTWSILIHLGGIVFGFVPSLVGYLLTRERGAMIRGNSAEALNFQITLAIAWFVAGLLANFVIGFFLLPVVAVVGIIFPILAAVAAARNEIYVYPVAIRLIR